MGAMQCPFCGGSPRRRQRGDNFEVCEHCTAYGPDEPFGGWDKLHEPTVVDRLSRQLGVDLRKWLSPLADQYEERGEPVPWGPARTMEEVESE